MVATKRAAWLTKTDGSGKLLLDDPDSGYLCVELDLGYPEVREDKDLRPDVHGTIDLTRLFGARVVTARLVAWGEDMTQDDIADLFAPFMDVTGRYQLHVTKDSANGAERVLTLRPSAWVSPMGVPVTRELHLAWIAPDPVMHDGTVHTAIVYPGSTGGGRVYPLAFNRVYPAGGQTTAKATNNGDVTAYPLLRIYGPASNINLLEVLDASGVVSRINFVATYSIPAGSYVEIDTLARTVLLNGDTSQSVYGQLAYDPAGRWPTLPPKQSTTWSMAATGISNATQLQVVWQDAYLL
jgi:hypothetical protein